MSATKRPARTASKRVGTPKDIDDYLSRVPETARAALEKLRKTIRSAAPNAEETISYQLASFRYLGPLVAFGATANHCAFYAMSGTALDGFADELEGYDTSKGTIRFAHNKSLPATLVKKIVKARIAENEARAARRKK